MTSTKLSIAALVYGVAMHAQAAVEREAPYIAEEVTERTQTLTDGNQLVSRSLQRIYHDSTGRVRREYYDEKGTLERVFLMDGTRNSYTLLPARKTATRSVAPAMRGQQGDAAAGKAGGATPQLLVSGVTRANGGATQVKVAGADSWVAPQWAGLLGDGKFAANRTSKALGLRFFEGVQAEGTLVSYEIPAGAQGNRLPITVSMECWTARDVPLVMYYKSSDPRSGEYLIRVTSLRRAEPSVELFTVPSDYKVIDQGAYTLTPVERKE